MVKNIVVDEKRQRPDLENDSVDSEILEDELRALEEEEILTFREKVVKTLNSNPVQILLCVIVILDAGIVISQILLDLHSVRAKLSKREHDITRLLDYIRHIEPEGFHGYEGHDVNYILQLLTDHNKWEAVRNNRAKNPPQSEKGDRRGSHHNEAATNDGSRSQSGSHGLHDTDHGGGNHRTKRFPKESNPYAKDLHDGGADRHLHGKGSTPRTHQGRTRRQSHNIQSNDRGLQATRKNMQNPPKDGTIMDMTPRDGNNLGVEGGGGSGGTSFNNNNKHNLTIGIFGCLECVRHSVYHKSESQYRHHVEKEEHDTLHEVAHGLHFASVALLGFLVVEDFVKMIAMGKEFFKHKIEIFDAIIITSSFIFDIVFLGGVTGEEGEKAAAVLVVLLLWRITRVVDGILITAKNRQEFRIRLQKRARRKAEKRVDNLEEDRHNKSQQIHALKSLCSKAGIHREEIELCTPRPRRVSQTMCALSSVARLSVSMTMSMSSGLFSMVEDDSDKDKDDSKDSHHLSSRDHHAGGAGSSSSHHNTDGGSSSGASSSGRRHSAPKVLTPGANMSDIEEESLTSQHSQLSQRAISPTSSDSSGSRGRGHSGRKNKGGKGSPKNTSGVRIIIDRGSGSDEDSVDMDNYSARDTLLDVTDIDDDYDESRQRRISQFSEVQLLP